MVLSVSFKVRVGSMMMENMMFSNCCSSLTMKDKNLKLCRTVEEALN